MNIAIVKQILLMRKAQWLAILALLIVAAGFQCVINYYQEPRVAKLAGDWLKQRELEGRGVALQDRDTLYRNGLADLAKFRERIYPKNNFAKFIGELYDQTARNGLELVAISYKPSLNKDEQLLEYSLALTVSGKYPQLKKFIADLGATGNILTIDSVSLMAVGTAGDTVDLKVMITSYFIAEAK